MIHAFGDHEVDEGLYQLRSRGRAVKIEPKVFDVLLHLIRHRERVVPKHELLDSLWPGEAVSESVLPRCIAAARRALGSRRARDRWIQTVHGRGYRFVGEIRERDEARPAERAEPVRIAPAEGGFVGRASALEHATAAVDAARAGRGGLLLLVGEPGIGKTRTADEITRLAAERGVSTVVGRCVEAEGAPAYWPFVQILRALVERLSLPELEGTLGPGADDVATLVPELRERLPHVGHVELEGEQARFRLFDGIAGFLRRASRESPSLVVVDDLHWADSDSLALLRFLARELGDAPVLLLSTYRDVDVRRHHALGEMLGSLASEPRCERIALRGLDRASVAKLVESLTGEAVSDAWIDAIDEMTEGNPFFVHEIVRWLADEGRLDQDPASLETLTLPQGLRDAIGRRLDSLTGECNQVLRLAAVVGREFALPLLERAGDVSGEALLEAIGEALAAHLLVESKGGLGRYAFAHALVRQTLYEELRIPQRVALHMRVAETLEAAGSEGPDAPITELAHHFYEAAPAGGAERAVTYSARAAERAYSLCAYAESARHYERALEAWEFAEQRDDGKRCQLLIALGESLWTSGERERARERLGAAAQLARDLAREDLFVRSAIAYRGFGEMAMPPDESTLGLLTDALERSTLEHPLLRSRLLARLTGTPPWSLSMATRERFAREAWQLAVESGDRSALADAVAARYWATLGPDRLPERLEVAEEALRLAERFDDRRLAILGHEIAIGAHLVAGDLQAALRACDVYEELAQALRMPLFRFLSCMIRGAIGVSIGQFDSSRTLMEEAARNARGAVPWAEPAVRGVLAWLLYQRGELESIASFLDGLESPFLAQMTGFETMAAAIQVGAAAEVGRLDEARAALEAFPASGLAQLERDENWLVVLSTLAMACGRLRDESRCSILYDLLLPHASLLASHDLGRVVLGSVEGVLGWLALTLERNEEAIAHLERALAREERCGLRPAADRSRVGLAEALQRRGGPGDRERAESLLLEVEDGPPSPAHRRAAQLRKQL